MAYILRLIRGHIDTLSARKMQKSYHDTAHRSHDKVYPYSFQVTETQKRPVIAVSPISLPLRKLRILAVSLAPRISPYLFGIFWTSFPVPIWTFKLRSSRGSPTSSSVTKMAFAMLLCEHKLRRVPLGSSQHSR
jgi:hypothetical protein